MQNTTGRLMRAVMIVPVAFLPLLMATACSPDANNIEWVAQDVAEGLIEGLQADGLAVREGALQFFASANRCETKHCSVLNPSGAYSVFALPPTPGERGALFNADIGDEQSLKALWRLDPGEAIVFLGRTPPAARYFSFAPYLVLRRSGYLVPRLIHASITNTLNNATIHVRGSGAPEEAFDKQTAIIITADRTVDTRIREILEQAGVSSEEVNTIALPYDRLFMGLGRKGDVLTVLFRVALFEDAELGEAYLDAPPALLFRVTPESSTARQSFVPLTSEPLIERGTGESESYLENALDQLEAAIRTAHPDARRRTYQTQGVRTTGRDCIEQGLPCFGECPDAAYGYNRYKARIANDPDESLIVFGVNHAATGKAIYSNIAIGWKARRKNGLVGGISNEEMPGSASLYLPDHPYRDLLFAYKVKRDCAGEPYCLSIPADYWGGKFQVDSRAYLEPGVGAGPAADELLWSRLIKVK